VSSQAQAFRGTVRVTVLFAGLVLVGGLLLLPTLSDLVSLATVLLFRSAPRVASQAFPRLLVLVPAHDEEMLLGACIESLLAMHYPVDRRSIVVIAHNCADRTADVARQSGVACLERHDRSLTGKPRAIAWALEQLPLSQYDAVVIVDADTIVDRQFAAALAERAPLRNKAVQGFYDVYNRNETALTQLASLLGTAIHHFAYPLKMHAGLNTPLVGNGMCIGSEVLLRRGWTAFSICEDWEMYAQLTEQGIRTECAPGAVVYAQEAHTLSESLSQRQRWTAGKLTVLKRWGPRIIRSRHAGIRQTLDAIGELTALGPVLHLGVVVLLVVLSAAVGAPSVVSVVLAASLVRPLAYSVAALCVQPNPLASLAAFSFLPVYAVWRVGAAMGSLALLRDQSWIRTQRHQHKA
jgi:cellulose synthase/poly-beta-1,6-N-acetylglucosamine synthase-like glycosyltransferase